MTLNIRKNETVLVEDLQEFSFKTNDTRFSNKMYRGFFTSKNFIVINNGFFDKYVEHDLSKAIEWFESGECYLVTKED